MNRLLLTGCFQYTTEQLKLINSLGFTVDFLKDEKAVVEYPERYIGVVCNNLFLYNDISLFKNLQFIQATSAGLDRLPLDYINSKNIILNSAKGVYDIPIAEFVVMQLLRCLKKNKEMECHISNHIWQKERQLEELYGKNVLIIGCGSIGQTIASRLHCFGCNVFGVDIHPISNANFKHIYLINQIDEILNDSDIIILCCPLTKETKQMINTPFISHFKKNAILINVSRGELIEENALRFAISNRVDLFFILDVFENEPLQEDSWLWDCKNIYISPHNSFASVNNSERMFSVIFSFLSKVRGLIK